MLHIDIMRKFMEITNKTDDDIAQWKPQGKGAVGIRLKDGSELIFTFTSNKLWRLETKAFNKRM